MVTRQIPIYEISKLIHHWHPEYHKWRFPRKWGYPYIIILISVGFSRLQKPTSYWGTSNDDPEATGSSVEAGWHRCALAFPGRTLVCHGVFHGPLIWQLKSHYYIKKKMVVALCYFNFCVVCIYIYTYPYIYIHIYIYLLLLPLLCFWLSCGFILLSL